MKHQRATSFASSRSSTSGVLLCFLPPSLFLLLILLLTNASYFVSGSDEDDPGSPGYCRLCELHTMCLFPFDDVGPKCIDVESGDLDSEEIRSIVHQHNVHRNNIAKGLETRGNPGPQPPGRNIMELTWDEELARIARRWALQCNPSRKDYCRNVERFHVWQNTNTLSLDVTNEGILEDPEEHSDPGSGIEEDVNATATTSPFMRIRFHVQSWLDEVEHFDTARVGLVDFSMENETSYVAIACAMITRVGCGRATYRTYLEEESKDEARVSLVPSEATDNKNDSGSSRVEVLVCNYGPIDPTTPQNLYEYGTLEFCPEGSLPSAEYDHLCAPSQDVGGLLSPGEMEYRVGKDGTLDSRWHGIVGSPGRHDENSAGEASRNSAVSIALRKTGDACTRFHPPFLQILKLVLLHVITKTPGGSCC
ncbi:venom allergen 5.01-like [Venturia canescens]|uniref:venom allergen 5.01-like n=1 Tax=Venturia canescens TaxID=32260 RepID=UPI001C9C85B0|nr:venom allergen 5.01-like [Venturia canescens]